MCGKSPRKCILVPEKLEFEQIDHKTLAANGAFDVGKITFGLRQNCAVNPENQIHQQIKRFAILNCYSNHVNIINDTISFSFILCFSQISKLFVCLKFERTKANCSFWIDRIGFCAGEQNKTKHLNEFSFLSE